MSYLVVTFLASVFFLSELLVVVLCCFISQMLLFSKLAFSCVLAFFLAFFVLRHRFLQKILAGRAFFVVHDVAIYASEVRNCLGFKIP